MRQCSTICKLSQHQASAALLVAIAALGSLPVAWSLVLRPVLRPTGKAAARAGDVQCWAGKSEATIEIQDVPAGSCTMATQTFDAAEWSPLLGASASRSSSSFGVGDEDHVLRWAAQRLGYLDEDAKLSWEADLDAPGLPLMRWTSVLDESSSGLPNAGFEPSGEVEFHQLGPGVSSMTLRLNYVLPETAPLWRFSWSSAPVQFVLQNRMTAG